jgi:surface antigen
MRALPFRRDRAMASAAANASPSGIGSGSPTYGRDISETMHRHHHGHRACSSSVISRASSYGGVIYPAAWRTAQWGRTSTCLDPQVEQRNPPYTSGNGVSTV